MELLANCRLCNYQSDRRLMMNAAEELLGYTEKIDQYLNLKVNFPVVFKLQSKFQTNYFQVFDDEKSPHFICFHCSQTLDNFHNFATKIKNIQKILYPKQEQEPEQQLVYEICVLPPVEMPIAVETSHQSCSSETTYKVTTIRTGSRRVNQEKAFENLKKADTDELSSNRSFDFEDNPEPFESDEDIPPRDPESDWPSPEALSRIPSKLIENGVLMFKGKALMKFMSYFYNTSCEMCHEKFRKLSDLFQHYKVRKVLWTSWH